MKIVSRVEISEDINELHVSVRKDAGVVSSIHISSPTGSFYSFLSLSGSTKDAADTFRKISEFLESL